MEIFYKIKEIGLYIHILWTHCSIRAHRNIDILVIIIHFIDIHSAQAYMCGCLQVHTMRRRQNMTF